MYRIQRSGKTIAFARTADYARDYVREDDPSARKTINSIYGVDIFTNGMSITLVDIKADKEGVITLLNSILSEPEPIQKPTEQLNEDKTIEWADRRRQELEGVGLSDAQVQIIREIYEAKTVSPTPEDELKVETIVPAIAYKVDNMPFPKKGRGTCLHCNKQVGFVGGFPSLNPPDVICD